MQRWDNVRSSWGSTDKSLKGEIEREMHREREREREKERERERERAREWERERLKKKEEYEKKEKVETVRNGGRGCPYNTLGVYVSVYCLFRLLFF